MESYDAPPRPLVFPLKNPLVESAVTEDDAECYASSFVWPEDSDERVLVPFMLSLNEYTVLSNTVDVGRDIAYGVDSIKVLWLWLRNMRCEVSICSMIIDCVMNDEDTKAAITNMLLSSDEFKDYLSQTVQGLTTGQITGPLVAGSCDNAVVAGKMLALVESLDQNNRDAFEIIEIGTNDEEKIAALLEGIPVLGELPFGDIIDFLQDLLEDFSENYDAASTTERKEALANDLYCLALDKPDCALSYADLFTFFQERVSSGLTLSSLAENIVTWVIGGDFSTDDLVFDGMMAMQIAFTRVGKEFFGINMPKIGALTRDASPSSIWEEWGECHEEPPDPECEVFEEDAGTWVPVVGHGQWLEGEGWAPIVDAGHGYFDILHPTEGANRVIVKIKVITNVSMNGLILTHGAVDYTVTADITELEITETSNPSFFPYQTGTGGFRYLYPSLTDVPGNFRIQFSCWYETE